MTLQSAFKSATGLEIEEAMNKAVKLGYNKSILPDPRTDKMPGLTELRAAAALGVFILDPSFWKCLGVAEGWTTLENDDCKIAFTLEAKSYPIRPRESIGMEMEDEGRAVIFRQRVHSIAHSVSKTWLYYMHLFVDRLAEEGE